MNDTAVANAKQLFQAKYPDFTSFGNASGPFFAEEISYKRAAAEQLRQLLGGVVRGVETLTTDESAKAIAHKAFELTNFMNWRDTAYIDELFADSGRWIDFMHRIVACLQGTTGDAWKERLASLLEWLKDLKCAANITKILPTYFLFFWDPQHHLCIKPRLLDSFLDFLGTTRTGGGIPLSVDTYVNVLDVFSQLKASLASWDPQDNIDLHSFAYVVSRAISATTTWPPGRSDSDAGGSSSEERSSSVTRPAIPLNLVLAGPPGTGKTHQLLADYIPRFEQTGHKQSLDAFVMEKCGDLTWQEVCVVALAMLNQPTRVPDLEGMAPIQAKKKSQGRTTGVQKTLWATMQVYTDTTCPNVQIANRCDPGLFWKDADSRWRLTEMATEVAPELLELAKKIKDFRPSEVTAKRYDFVTFHQSYSYEDFVEGIKPVLADEEATAEAGQVRYDIVPGIFRRLVTRAIADPENSYCLFIDEINRANISNVLGELITLLEPDKRMHFDMEKREWTGGLRVRLPYTHSMRPTEPLFGVPNNLYLIGTMNTADRSIALMDYALRRRFDFEEVAPDPDLLRTTPGPVDCGSGKSVQLDKMLEAMNRRIEYLRDRDHKIGHSYFMQVRSLKDLEDVFHNKILPLLQEYFYGDWEKIQLVLNDLTSDTDADAGPRSHPDAIVTHVVQRAADVLGQPSEAFQDRRSYEVSDDLSARSFTKIYEGTST